MLHSNHEPISYRFRDERQFQSKIANYPHPVYLTPPLKEFPLEFGNDATDHKLEWWSHQMVTTVLR